MPQTSNPGYSGRRDELESARYISSRLGNATAPDGAVNPSVHTLLWRTKNNEVQLLCRPADGPMMSSMLKFDMLVNWPLIAASSILKSTLSHLALNRFNSH